MRDTFSPIIIVVAEDAASATVRVENEYGCDVRVVLPLDLEETVFDGRFGVWDRVSQKETS